MNKLGAHNISTDITRDEFEKYQNDDNKGKTKQ